MKKKQSLPDTASSLEKAKLPKETSLLRKNDSAIKPIVQDFTTIRQEECWDYKPFSISMFAPLKSNQPTVPLRPKLVEGRQYTQKKLNDYYKRSNDYYLRISGFNETASKAVNALYSLALRGEIIAAGSLVDLGIVICKQLAYFAEKEPILLTFSTRKTQFPVLAVRNVANKKRIKQILQKALPDCYIRYRISPKSKKGGKIPSFDTPINRLAIELCDHIFYYRGVIRRIKTPHPAWLIDAAQLPPLDTDSADQWSKVACDVLDEATDGHPERIPELEGFGEYRRKHSVYQDQQKLVTPATAAANINDGIHEKLYQAIGRLAPFPPD